MPAIGNEEQKLNKRRAMEKRGGWLRASDSISSRETEPEGPFWAWGLCNCYCFIGLMVFKLRDQGPQQLNKYFQTSPTLFSLQVALC